MPPMEYDDGTYSAWYDDNQPPTNMDGNSWGSVSGTSGTARGEHLFHGNAGVERDDALHSNDDEYSLEAFQQRLDQLTESLENDVNLECVLLDAKRATTTRQTPSVFDDTNTNGYGTHHETETTRSYPNGGYIDNQNGHVFARTTPERYPNVASRSVEESKTEAPWLSRESTSTPNMQRTTDPRSRASVASVATPEPPTPVKTPLRHPPASSPYRHHSDRANDATRPHHPSSSYAYHPTEATVHGTGSAGGVGAAAATERERQIPLDGNRSPEYPTHSVRPPTSAVDHQSAAYPNPTHSFRQPTSAVDHHAAAINVNQQEQQQSTSTDYFHNHPRGPSVAESSRLAGVRPMGGDSTTAIPSRVTANDAGTAHRNSATASSESIQDLTALIVGLRDTLDRHEQRIRMLEEENEQWRRQSQLRDNDRTSTPGWRFVAELAQVMEIPPENYAPLSRIMDLQLERLVLEDRRRRRSLGYR